MDFLLRPLSEVDPAEPSDAAISTTSPSAPSSSPFCPLLALPAELRTVIYSYVFPTAAVHVVDKSYSPPGLPRTCSLLRAETLGFFYARTVFRCVDQDASTRWLARLHQSQWLRVLREVQFDARAIVRAKREDSDDAEVREFRSWADRLAERGVDVRLFWEQDGRSRLKVSYRGPNEKSSDDDHDVNVEKNVCWTDKPGLIEAMKRARAWKSV